MEAKLITNYRNWGAPGRMGACASALDALDSEIEGPSNLLQDAAAVFRLIDADRNGTISTAEFAASKRFTALMKKQELSGGKKPTLPPDPDLKAFLKFIQTLDEIEAVVLVELMEKELVIDPIIKDAKTAFQMLDTSGDGRIDLKSEAGILEDFPGQMVLQDMDFDNNGSIEWNEFLKTIRTKANSSPARTSILLKSLVLHMEKKGIKPPDIAPVRGGTGASDTSA